MRRLGIFLFHDAAGRVPAHVRTTLAAFRPWLDTLIFVSNGLVEPESYARIADLVTRRMIRPNEGFDAGGYRDALGQIGFSRLAEWDEVVLFNATFYTIAERVGPMFRAMAKRDLDFWGMTAYDDGEKDFLQSYFLVTRARLHGSRAWRDYWEGLPPIRSMDDCLQHFEFSLTRHFRDQGFRGAPYIENAPGWTGNTTLIDIEGLHARGMPVLKYRALTFDALHLAWRGGRSGAQNLAFATATGCFAMEEIWADLIARTPPDDLIRNAGLMRILPETQGAPATPGALYLVALAEPRTLPFALERLDRLPAADVCITTADPGIAALAAARGWACRAPDASGLALPVWADHLAPQAMGRPVICLSDFAGERERYFFEQSLFRGYWDPLLQPGAAAWLDQAPHLGLVFVPPDAVAGRERMLHGLSHHGQNWSQPDLPDWAGPALGQQLWPWRGNCVIRGDLLSDPGFAAGLADMAPRVAHRPREVFAGLEALLPQLARCAGAAAGMVAAQDMAPGLILRAALVERQADDRLQKARKEFRAEVTRLRALARGAWGETGEALDETQVTMRLTAAAQGPSRLEVTVAGRPPVSLSPGTLLRVQIDNVDISRTRVHVHGWAFDPEDPSMPLVCGVMIDGVLAGRLGAVAAQRPDVRAAFPDLDLRGDTGFDIQRHWGLDIDPARCDIRLCVLDSRVTRATIVALGQPSSPAEGPISVSDKGI
jgi:hypothetical protein